MSPELRPSVRIDAAQQLETTTLISQVGDFREGVPRGEQHGSLVDGLREAAPMLEQSGITLVIEPRNELVHLIHNIVSNIGKIGHFHAAGNSGRNELQRGEIDYLQVFSAIRETGYDGFVGLEYRPLDGDSGSALREVAGWMTN